MFEEYFRKIILNTVLSYFNLAWCESCQSKSAAETTTVRPPKEADFQGRFQTNRFFCFVPNQMMSL